MEICYYEEDKKKPKLHFKQCRRCTESFHGKKHAKICADCDKRGKDVREQIQGYSGDDIEEIIHDKLENFRKII